MSTYVLMRILESAPRRYDLGMRLITLGAVDRAYDALAAHVKPGQRVLDIGCGTGALTLRIARRGARARGIDVNPEMLDAARRRIARAGLDARVELAEMGVAQLDAEPAASYDAVASGLCFSELSADERAYTLREIARVLKPEGLLLIADETRPHHPVLRLLTILLRIPLSALTYVLTQQTTHPLGHLPADLSASGFRLIDHSAHALGTFGVFIADRPGVKPR